LSIVYFRISARAAQAPERAPLLERLLARAALPRRVADWRAEAFRALAPQATHAPAVASAAARGAAPALERSSARWAMLATPLHLSAGLRDLQLGSDGILSLEAEEAAALATDFNAVFAGGGVELARGRATSLLCLFDAPLEVITTDPEQLIGADIFAALARGADAARLKRLASELEMWLHDHAVNARRRARQAPVISSLWLWGGGSLDAAWPPVEGWTAGRDPLFAAFPQESRYPSAARGARARPGVVVIAAEPGTACWQSVEERFVAPAVADLKARRLSGIELSAGDRAFRLSARGLRRFWRSARPWWETIGESRGASDSR